MKVSRAPNSVLLGQESTILEWSSKKNYSSQILNLKRIISGNKSDLIFHLIKTSWTNVKQILKLR